jgi:hypothetical protein
MNELLGDLKTKVKSLQARRLVSYRTAWTYYPKGTVIFSSGTNCELLTKIVNTEYGVDKDGKHVFNIKTEGISFDGEAFTWEQNVLTIPKFQGYIPITELQHYPLQYHADPQQVKARMQARGRLVLDYQGLTYCTYNGIALANCDGKKHNVG